MTHFVQTFGYVVGLLVSLSILSPVQAQGKKGAEFIPGTVASIEKNEKDKTGRTYKMKVTKTDDGSELEVAIGLKTPVIVSGKGDEGFLVPGVTIETKALMSQNNLFADEFTAYLGPVLPQSRVTPDKEKPKEIFEVVGKILETRPDGFMVQMGNTPQKIGFEVGKLAVNVKISDASLIKEGDEVTVEGTIVKSKKTLTATMITVTKKDPIVSADYLATLEDKRKPKGGTAKTKTAAGKAKTDAADDAGAPKSSDPFGILSSKKKTAKEKADEKKEKAEEKKEEAKKAAEKKDDAKPEKKPE